MKRFIVLAALIILFTNFLGCAAFQRKFVRERKKEDRPHPVVYFKDYAEDISYHELYEKHFLFWKYWELELVNALEQDNNKKQILALTQSISSLRNIESYLVPEKQEGIGLRRQELEKIEPIIRRGFSSSLERLRLKQEVEKHQRMLEKELMYKKMKEFIRTKEGGGGVEGEAQK